MNYLPRAVRLSRVASLFALVLFFAASSPRSTWAATPGPDGLGLPVLPGSDYARRLQWQSDEAKQRLPPVDDVTSAPGLGSVAADYAMLPAAAWVFEHQDITVDLAAAQEHVVVHLKAAVRAVNSNVTTLRFRTDPIDNITVSLANGATVTASYSPWGDTAGFVDVELTEPLPVGETSIFVVDFDASIDCSKKTSMLPSCALEKTFKVLNFFQYYLANAFAPHSPFPSNLHVITDADEQAAAPGTPSGPDVLEDGRAVWHFEQVERTSNAGFAIAPYEPFDDPAGAGLVPRVRVYTVPPYSENADTIHQLARELIDWYGANYIPFPWAGLNLIQAQKSFGGGYAPLGGVFMLRDIFSAYPGTGGWQGAVELLAHEIAHQWWGNLVRPLGSGDVSVSESLAEFSSCLYTEKILGTRSQLITDSLGYVYNVSSDHDVPMASTYVYGSPAYVEIIYHKGAAVFEMLRHELGEKLMLAGLAKLATDFGRDYARVQDIQKVMEQASDRDLDWFFEQWFFGTGAIRAELIGRVDANDDGGFTWRLRISQLTKKPRRFKLPVLADLADGTQVQVDIDVIPDSGAQITTVEAKFASRPQRIRPDPTRKLLRFFSLLTAGDVNLDGLVDGGDLVEMAFRYGNTIVYEHRGQDYFWPNAAWDELHDIESDHRVNQLDVDKVLDNVGAEAFEF